MKVADSVKVKLSNADASKIGINGEIDGVGTIHGKYKKGFYVRIEGKIRAIPFTLGALSEIEA